MLLAITGLVLLATPAAALQSIVPAPPAVASDTAVRPADSETPDPGTPGSDPHEAAPDSDALEAAGLEPDDLEFDFEDESWPGEEPADPLECSNRWVFSLNDQLYRFVFDPVADVWEFVVPSPVRSSVRRFFSNLREPANLVNELIQLHGRRARTTGARFLLNSTVGVAGLFDPAQHWGLEPYNTDFGQTLALYGVADGAYLVLPVVGPANLRDALGQLVDAAMRPDIWLLAPGTQLVFVTSDGLAGYETRRIHLDELRKSSFDFYAAMRSAYRMDRAAQIESLRQEEPTAKPADPPAPGARAPDAPL